LHDQTLSRLRLHLLFDHALLPGGLTFLRLLWRFFLLRFFFALLFVIVFLVVLGILKPVDEVLQDDTHFLFSLAIIEAARLVELHLLVMPVNKELIGYEARVVENFAERCSLSLHFRVTFEEEYDSLEDSLQAQFFVLLHELSENWLIRGPVLDWRA